MPNGILLLDKPLGLSSNGALQRVRKASGARKAGHVGSLDPLATGMLPICLGEATKVVARDRSGAQALRFTVALGARTDTGDAEGAVVETLPVPALDAPALESVLRGFRGTQQQVPPMYSALKRDGRPLYELARAGHRGRARGARHRDLSSCDAASASTRATRCDLDCECAKGTYIRVLGEDIARALGTCGHLTRAAAAVGRAVRGDADGDARRRALEAPSAAGSAARRMPRCRRCPICRRSAERAGRRARAARPGGALRDRATVAPGAGAALRPGGRVPGIGEADAGRPVQPRRLFAAGRTVNLVL